MDNKTQNAIKALNNRFNAVIEDITSEHYPLNTVGKTYILGLYNYWKANTDELQDDRNFEYALTLFRRMHKNYTKELAQILQPTSVDALFQDIATQLQDFQPETTEEVRLMLEKSKQLTDMITQELNNRITEELQ